MLPNRWEWPVVASARQHRVRLAVMRTISFEATNLIGEEEVFNEEASAGR